MAYNNQYYNIVQIMILLAAGNLLLADALPSLAGFGAAVGTANVIHGYIDKVF